jgi:hypothetical protein
LTESAIKIFKKFKKTHIADNLLIKKYVSHCYYTNIFVFSFLQFPVYRIHTRRFADYSFCTGVIMYLSFDRIFYIFFSKAWWSRCAGHDTRQATRCARKRSQQNNALIIIIIIIITSLSMQDAF